MEQHPIVFIHEEPSTSSQTTSDILKIPTMSTHKQQRQRKGFKVSYGVIDVEIIMEIENREIEEQKIAEDHMKDEEAKRDRNEKLKRIREKVLAETEVLKATRNHLKNLESEAAEERKKIALKRKNIALSKKKKQAAHSGSIDDIRTTRKTSEGSRTLK